MVTIPTIDLQEETFQIKSKLLDAIVNFGFFYLKGHKIDQELTKFIFKSSKVFFEKEIDYKMKYKYNLESNFGYTSLYQEKLNLSSETDPKEAFNMLKSIDLHYPDEFKNQNFQLFKKNLHRVAMTLLRYLAEALEISSDYFTSKHKFDEPSGDVFRLLNYPPSSSYSIIAGGHTDYGTMTLLFQDFTGGLEVFCDEQWIPVIPMENTLIVNAGDILSFWSGGHFKSAIHRVVSTKSTITRQSMAYFLHPYDETPLTLIPSKKIPSDTRAYEENSMEYTASANKFSLTAKEHLQYRLKQSYF
eukprot:NODE_44_length_33449_cov_1.575742.p16 type:complete len:302 gc:universal NODE_44_length_33449_cov_1.575742:13382-12477(-)